MKVLKKGIQLALHVGRFGLYGLSALVLGLSLFALAVFIWPSLLVNERSLEWGSQIAAKRNLSIAWDAAEVHARSLSFLVKRVDFKFKKLCIRNGGASSSVFFDGCLDRVEVGATVDFHRLPPELVELNPLVLESLEDLEVKLIDQGQPERQKQKSPKDEPFVALPPWLQRVEPGRVEISLPSLRVKLPDQEIQEIQGRALLTHEPRKNQENSEGHWIFRTSGQLAGREAPMRSLTAELEAFHSGQGLHGRWRAKGTAGAELQAGERITAYAELEDSQFRARATFRQHRRTAELSARGSLGQKEIEATLSGRARGWSRSLNDLVIRDCKVRWASEAVLDSSMNSRLQADCPLRAQMPLPPVKGIPDLQLPSRTGARLKADLRTVGFPSPGAPLRGQLSLVLDPVLTPLFRGEGSVEARVDGVPAEYPEGFKIDSRMQAELSVPDFKKWVQALSRTGWAVPAPINQLGGPVTLSADGTLKDGQLDLPFQVRTELASRDQSLDLRWAGQVRVKELGSESAFTQLEGKLELSKVKLALPRLDLEAPPRFVPDSRIKAQAPVLGQSAGEVSSTELDYRAYTPEGAPLLLLMNLAKKPIPLKLELAGNSETPVHGSVRIEDFPIELFKRDARVEYLTLQLKPELDQSEVGGSIRVSYADYTIRIGLGGSLKKPDIHLTSDPPLPEDQVVAVLVFGKPMEELDPEQGESVGNTRAALADGALGLASLYALAATPIESVGYDPGKRVFSAKVRLGEGTSLNVGEANGALEHLGVRKRLSRFWTITSEVSQSSEDGSRTVATLLEWRHRY